MAAGGARRLAGFSSMNETNMTTRDSAFDHEVLVIGGGPGGSTTACRLAQLGHDVILVDKDHHPRFHIGESLLPASLPLLDELGVGERVARIGMKKLAAEFVSPTHGWRKQVFHFADAWDKSMPYAWQVRRSEFDEILLRNAADKGAQVREGCLATAVDFNDGGQGATVQLKHEDGSQESLRVRYVVDASGRDTFLANKFKLKHKNPRHSSAAIYTHFTGVARNPGEAEGNITVFWFDHGWFWFIPLSDGATSVGMVTWPYHLKTRGERSLDQFLMDNIASAPPLAERLQGAERVHEMVATGNFSYSSERCHGPGYLLVGDAYAFVDPVFSSGVQLALQAGKAAADCLHTCLTEPAREARALAEFERIAMHGPRHFSWFIYRMTNPIMRDLFMGPRNIFRAQEALLSLLAGDLYGKTPIWNSLRFLKAVYYTDSLRQLPRAIRAWRRRRHNIRPVDQAA
jgi:flavin-dependent dehydrogenase